MPLARSVPTPLPVGSAIAPSSLRAALETRRARGDHFSLSEAVALLVPLCLDLAKRHRAGEAFVVHPSSLRLEGGRLVLPDVEAQRAPAVLPRDRACLAPEERRGGRGDERASVFSMGAIFYELVTGESLGPGMRRAAELKAGLPSSVDVVLGQALIAEAASRPNDLRALAAAFYQLAPDTVTAPPASADISHLEVDVSCSMLPPPPRASTPAPPPAARADATSRLAEMKARLEGDRRPRYVVVRDGIDHGPFNGIELLQQIARHTFNGDDILRDLYSKEERAVQDWDEFAPFAEQAKLHREVKAEKAAMERTLVAEKKATLGKAVAGGGLLLVLAAGAIVWVTRDRGARSDEVRIEGDNAVSVEVQGGVHRAAGNKASPGGQGRPAPAGGYPSLPGGLSCEGAQSRYSEEMRIGEKGPPDLSRGQFEAVLNKGSYLNGCGLPSDSKLNICTAVQNGRAVGVTVVASPRNPSVEACVAGRVRGLSFPSNPRLDVTRTTF